MMKKLLYFLLVFLFIIGANVPPVLAANATFSLSPATSSVSLNQVFTVDILADTGGSAVSNMKVVITYDTTKLMVVDSDSSKVGTQILPGTLVSQLPLTNTVDGTAGTVTYDTGTLSPTFTGHGTLATITFKGIAAGVAQPSFNYTQSSITGTGGTNILTSVEGGSYTIGSGTNTTTAATTTTTTTTPTTVTGALPTTGAVEDTLAVLGIAGICLLASFALKRGMI